MRYIRVQFTYVITYFYRNFFAINVVYYCVVDENVWRAAQIALAAPATILKNSVATAQAGIAAGAAARSQVLQFSGAPTNVCEFCNLIYLFNSKSIRNNQ